MKLYEEFEEKFKPINHPKTGEDHFDSTELKLVKKLAKDFHYVWTVVEADGKFYVCPGYVVVNCHQYVVCEIPWKDANDEYRWDDPVGRCPKCDCILSFNGEGPCWNCDPEGTKNYIPQGENHET